MCGCGVLVCICISACGGGRVEVISGLTLNPTSILFLEAGFLNKTQILRIWLLLLANLP